MVNAGRAVPTHGAKHYEQQCSHRGCSQPPTAAPHHSLGTPGARFPCANGALNTHVGFGLLDQRLPLMGYFCNHRKIAGFGGLFFLSSTAGTHRLVVQPVHFLGSVCFPPPASMFISGITRSTCLPRGCWHGFPWEQPRRAVPLGAKPQACQSTAGIPQKLWGRALRAAARPGTWGAAAKCAQAVERDKDREQCWEMSFGRAVPGWRELGEMERAQPWGRGVDGDGGGQRGHGSCDTATGHLQQRRVHTGFFFQTQYRFDNQSKHCAELVGHGCTLQGWINTGRSTAPSAPRTPCGWGWWLPPSFVLNLSLEAAPGGEMGLSLP